MYPRHKLSAYFGRVTSCSPFVKRASLACMHCKPPQHNRVYLQLFCRHGHAHWLAFSSTKVAMVNSCNWPEFQGGWNKVHGISYLASEFGASNDHARPALKTGRASRRLDAALWGSNPERATELQTLVYNIPRHNTKQSIVRNGLKVSEDEAENFRNTMTILGTFLKPLACNASAHMQHTPS